ncbi:hypothetical protein TcCL_ESM10157, partial [Trypanosoma cruzi]
IMNGGGQRHSLSMSVCVFTHWTPNNPELSAAWRNFARSCPHAPYRAAAVKAPHVSGRTEWSMPSVLQRQHGTRTQPQKEAACPELKCSANGSTAIMPSVVASPCS